MAVEYQAYIEGQPGFFRGTRRKFHIYYAVPDAGINADTGILLLFSGYGAGTDSRVYRKMRRSFADSYNMITLQCDYFGSRFMKGKEHLFITEDVLAASLSEEEMSCFQQKTGDQSKILEGKTLIGYVDLKENPAEYNEMGPIQAMDHLVALSYLFSWIREQGMEAGFGRIMAYGQSHGAYLAYLCNALAPGMFSAIIDNSAYLFPYYMDADRELYVEGELFHVRKLFHFLVSDLVDDREIYDLRGWYQSPCGGARILSFHGKEDDMVSLSDKREFIRGIPNAKLYEIDKDKVDGRCFFSARHGLDADFLQMFSFCLHELGGSIPTGGGEPVPVSVETQKYIYALDWGGSFPVLKRWPKAV